MLRSYPSYRVYSPASVLTLKPIPPTFKTTTSTIGNTSLVIDKVGRVLVEITPRSERGIDWSEGFNFGLAPDECMLVAHQIPEHDVEIVRGGNGDGEGGGGGGGGGGGAAGVGDDLRSVSKVLRVSPGSGASVDFEIVYCDSLTGVSSGGVDIKLTAGEYGVVRRLMEGQVERCLGWDVMGWGNAVRNVWDAEGMRGDKYKDSGQSNGFHGVPF